MGVGLCRIFSTCSMPALVLMGWIVAAVTAPAGEAPSYSHDIKPLLDTFCFKCHNARKNKGSLDLTAIAGNEDAARRATRVWRGALTLLHHQDMPPEDAPQPSQAERERLIAWIEQLKRPDGPPDPGRVTTRRLNRTEYDLTIRDLTGLDLNLAKDFPSDDVGNGFDNIGDVLSLPPLLLEKYLDAAGVVVTKAIGNERLALDLTGEQLPAMQQGKPVPAKADGKARTLTMAGEVQLDVVVATPGRHTLKLTVAGDQAGTEPVRLVVKLGTTVMKEQQVKAPRTSPTTINIPLTLEAGPCRVSLHFANPHTEPEPPKADPKAEPKKKPAAGSTAPQGKPGIRALIVERVELLGPTVPALPESHQRIVVAKPSATVTKRDAARMVIERFAGRAFRRPLDDAQTTRLMALFDIAERQGESYEASLRFVLQAVLVSPQFLFRVERDRPGTGPLGAYALDGYELASRLSYFLWSSMPDDELFAVAKNGTLSDPVVLEQQARRMLKDPKSRALVRTFAEQWLQMRNLDTVQPDRTRFPEFDAALKTAMYDEVALFFDTIVREDRSVLEFIDADWTFLNERLAKHYGISGVSGAPMRRVQLTDHNRGGVLGMANFLTITSNPVRTNPTKRGKWILEEILGTPPPPAPMGVAELPERGAAGTAGLSLRQLMEKHRADPACASCHARMDPLGFGFENFDAIGRWRADDDGSAVDASGVLPGGQTFRGPAALKTLLLARTNDFNTNLTSKLLTFALGRGLTESDDVVVEQLAARLVAGNQRFSALVTGVVTSLPFRYRRPGP